MKKFAVLVFAALMLLLPHSGLADGEDVSVTYNGRPLSFADAKPVVIDGRVLLPFRGVFEQMGASVGYSSLGRLAFAEFNGRRISFSLDKREIYASGSAAPVYVMDVPPTVIDGRVLVPVRAVAEAGGLSVGWDASARTVNVIDRAGLENSLKAPSADMKTFKSLFVNAAEVYKTSESLSVRLNNASVGIKADTFADGAAVRTLCSLAFDDSEQTTAELEIITTAASVYVKTSSPEAIVRLLPSAAKAVTAISADRWYKADFAELEALLTGRADGSMKRAADEANAELAIFEAAVKALADGIIFEANPSSAEAVAAAFARADACGVSVDYNADGTATAVMNVGQILSFEGTYSGGVALKSSLSLKTDAVSIEGTSVGEPWGTVEKIILPEKTGNLADVIYTIMRL